MARRKTPRAKAGTWRKFVDSPFVWMLLGLVVSWLVFFEPALKAITLAIAGWGGLFIGPFLALTGLLRWRMSSQREATAWRNRFITSVPLISILASAPTLGTAESSDGGGLLGDLLPMMLSLVLGKWGYWLASGLAAFATYWVLLRPLMHGRVFHRLGFGQFLEDTLGDVAEADNDNDPGAARTDVSSKRSKVKVSDSIEEQVIDEDSGEHGSPSDRAKSLGRSEATSEAIEAASVGRLRGDIDLLINEEEGYEPLPLPQHDAPLSLGATGLVANEPKSDELTATEQQVDAAVLADLEAAIKRTVKDVAKVQLERSAEPIIGMSTIRFEFSKATRDVSVKKLEALSEDIGLATQRESVRISVSPAILIELSLNEEERQFAPIVPLLQEVQDVDQNDPPSYLIGRTQDRKPFYLDAEQSVHVLVAGTSGGGKSVLLHSIVWGLIFRYPPSKVRLAFYDHKAVEFSRYQGLPHLWQNIVTNQGGFYRMLENVKLELAHRKQALKADPDATFSWLVIVMDEFRGLTNDEFVSIVSEARAFQIRFILGTQRADKESVDTRIKGNLITNIALKTRNHIDSNMILGSSDAQHLLLKGDCIVRCGNGDEERVQAGWVDSDHLAALDELLDKYEAH